jgi:hypothetical protein
MRKWIHSRLNKDEGKTLAFLVLKIFLPLISQSSLLFGTSLLAELTNEISTNLQKFNDVSTFSKDDWPFTSVLSLESTKEILREWGPQYSVLYLSKALQHLKQLPQTKSRLAQTAALAILLASLSSETESTKQSVQYWIDASLLCVQCIEEKVSPRFVETLGK